MSEGKGFADYAAAKRPKYGRCSSCGGPGEGRVAVTLQERRKHPTRTAKDANAVAYPSIDSTSRTFCEPCAVRVYEAAKAALDA